MNALAEGCLSGFIELIMVASWKAIRSGTWWSVPVIAFLGFVTAVLFQSGVMPALRPPITDMSAESLALMQPGIWADRVYRVSGSAMASLDSDGSIGASSERTYFGLLNVGNRRLLVSSHRPIDETQLTYEGQLVFSLDAQVKGQLEDTTPEQSAALLPMTLNVYQRQLIGETVVFLVIDALLAALTGYAIWRFISVSLLQRA